MMITEIQEATKEKMDEWLEKGYSIVTVEGRGLEDWGQRFYLACIKGMQPKVGLLMPHENPLNKKIVVISVSNDNPLYDPVRHTLESKGIERHSRVGRLFAILMEKSKMVHERVNPGTRMYKWLPELNLVEAFELIPDEYDHQVEALNFETVIFKGSMAEAKKFTQAAGDSYRSSTGGMGPNGTGWDPFSPSYSYRVVDIKKKS